MLTNKEIIEIRKDFKYLNNNDYIYFDNGATTQKPIQVIDRIVKFYENENGNPHRGAHYYAIKSTEVYEEGRHKIASFINANDDEVVFVRNTTEGLNLLAYSYGINELKEGDEILISVLEHHSNSVPWQFVSQKTGAKLVYLDLDENNQITEEEFNSKFNDNTKILSLTMASNVVGTMPDVEKFIKIVREKNSKTKIFLDAAQYAPHNKIDVKSLDCDALAFSAHKMLGPLGIGVLYGKREFLNSISPFMYGGDMIEYVYQDHTTYLKSPQRFEAGTANVEGVVGFAAAIDYINEIGMRNISEYENELTKYCFDRMKELNYLDVYTTPNKKRSPVISFNFKEAHPHDVASILDNYNIAVRSGHHCAQILHRYLCNNFSCRASFAFYNTFEEIDKFIKHLDDVRRLMGIGS